MERERGWGLIREKTYFGFGWSVVYLRQVASFDSNAWKKEKSSAITTCTKSSHPPTYTKLTAPYAQNKWKKSVKNETPDTRHLLQLCAKGPQQCSVLKCGQQAKMEGSARSWASRRTSRRCRPSENAALKVMTKLESHAHRLGQAGISQEKHYILYTPHLDQNATVQMALSPHWSVSHTLPNPYHESLKSDTVRAPRFYCCLTSA